MSHILEISDLSVRYGPLVAVDRVSLALETGQVLSICGRNGAGKSSLLNAVAGLEPRTGAVRVDGKELPSQDPRAAVRSGLSIVLERRGLFPNLTVEANLRVALYGRGARTNRAVRRADALARAFEYFPPLAGKRRELAGSLSGGQQQMLALGRAIVSRPAVLLLDEPSIGLAPKMIGVVFDAIAAMKAEGMSMVLVEENPQRALEVADQQVVFERGVVTLNSSAAHIRSHPEEFKSAYFGRVSDASATAFESHGGGW